MGQHLRGLTLTQPWASLVATGQKMVETRSWKCQYRGFVAIHAAMKMPPPATELAVLEFALGALPHPSLLPHGAIVAVANLGGVVGIDAELRARLSRRELELGDYADHRFALMFKEVWALDTPVPCRGALGLWPVPREVKHAVLAHVPEGAGRP